MLRELLTVLCALEGLKQTSTPSMALPAPSCPGGTETKYYQSYCLEPHTLGWNISDCKLESWKSDLSSLGYYCSLNCSESKLFYRADRRPTIYNHGGRLSFEADPKEVSSCALKMPKEAPAWHDRPRSWSVSYVQGSFFMNGAKITPCNVYITGAENEISFFAGEVASMHVALPSQAIHSLYPWDMGDPIKDGVNVVLPYDYMPTLELSDTLSLAEKILEVRKDTGCFDSKVQIQECRPEGQISGYAAVWSSEINNALFGTIVYKKGAHQETIALWREKGMHLPMLWDHKAFAPLGVWHTLKEDDNGLQVVGQLNLTTSLAKKIFNHMQSGLLDGLSVGGVPRRSTTHRMVTETKEQIEKEDLLEISVVPIPADPMARINQLCIEEENFHSRP